MANEIDIYDPRTLVEVVRTTPPIHTFLRDRFFSHVKPFTSENVDIDIVKGTRKMAARPSDGRRRNRAERGLRNQVL